MHKRTVFVLAILSACFLTGCKATDYSKAQKAYEKEAYAEAAAAFAELGEYKDSSEMILVCKYAEAGRAMDSEEYLLASDLFNELEDYEDSESLYKQCQYALGEKAYRDKNWDEAISFLTDLNYAPPNGYSATELLILSHAQRAYFDSDYQKVVDLMDSFTEKENESIYAEAALQLLKSNLEASVEGCDTNLALDAIETFIERTGDGQAINSTLEVLFTDLVQSEAYDVFLFMDNIIANVSNQIDTDSLATIVDEAYVQRVSSFLVGKWKRDDDTPLSGAVLEVLKADDGSMTGLIRDVSNVAVPDRVFFKVNDIKWKDFKIWSADEFMLWDMSLFNDLSTGERLSVNYDSAVCSLDYENECIYFHVTNTGHAVSGYRTASQWGTEQKWLRIKSN